MGRFLFTVFTLFILLYVYGCGIKGSGGDVVHKGDNTGITWSKTFGKGFEDLAYSIQQTTDGGYIVAGYTDLYGTQNGYFLVLKLDSNGNLMWDKTFGGNADDKATSIQQTSDGGYIVAGYTKSYGAGNGDFWVLKLDSYGNTIWDKTFGDLDFEVATSIKQTSDGGYIVAGHKFPSGAWVIKLDSNGNILWDKILGGSRGANSIQQTSDGGYIVAGYIVPYGGASDNDFWVIKLDTDGQIIWDKKFGSGNTELANSIQQTSDGGYIVAGYIRFDLSDSDFWVIKLDSNGNIEWDKKFRKRHQDVANSIYQTLDGGYIVAGYTAWNNDTAWKDGRWDDDFWIIKIDSNGNLMWDKTFGGNADDTATSIQQTSDGGYVVAGYTLSNRGGYGCWVIKLNSDGDLFP